MQLLLYVGGLGIRVKHDTLEFVDGIIMGVSHESFSKILLLSTKTVPF